jgi:threonine synthase
MLIGFICPDCGAKAPLNILDYKCACGGLFVLDYTPPAYSADLIDPTEWNIFRYRAFMPLENEFWRDVTLGEGMTATLPYQEGLYLKLDYAMPTLSFKDRGAAALIWLCKTIGISRVLQDSSGNAGNSVAAYCARAGIDCEIYVPKGTSPKKIAMIEAHGATCTVFDGSRDQTADACRQKAAQEGIYYANHVYNPLFYEGTKTFIYEVFEQLGRIPDNLFIPVGNGTLLLGCQQALMHLYSSKVINRLPKLYIVQSERCAPLYGAQGSPRDITPEETYAEGIAIGKPMRGRQILGGGYAGPRGVILAPEADILSARQALARDGLFVEHTTAATYAAYQALVRRSPLEGDALIPLCGAGLKSEK